MATIPSISAQNTRWGFGESSLPPEVRWSTTSEPESDDVTKNEINSTPMNDTSPVSGNSSSISNSAVARLSFTAVAISRAPVSWRFIDEPPKTENQKKHSTDGMKITPSSSSRTERPLEIRATNMPTNGDQEIHHPQ